MWISQRTGRNTAIITPIWAFPVGLCVLAGLAEHVLERMWPLLVFVAVAYIGYLLVRRYGEKSATTERLAKRFRERE